MKIVSPRVIVGNRGDLLSRFGILEALSRYNVETSVVFAHSPKDIRPLVCQTLPYGPLSNLWPGKQGIRALRDADIVTWTGGLDLQDDSSLLKLIHTWITFLSYRLLGKRIIVLMQGAGPLTTQAGRWLTRRILNLVHCFIARDSGTLRLLEGFRSRTLLVRADDGIFLEGIDRLKAAPPETCLLDRLTNRRPGQPLVGLNIRLWFHFHGSLLPYQLARTSYLKRAREGMEKLITAARTLVTQLRTTLNARVVLISMYEPNSQPWEDDLPYLRRIKDGFVKDSEVALLTDPITLGGFCDLMGRLDLMIGSRLHSTLAALRQGVPVLNLAYTNKCGDIFGDLGLSDNSFGLDSFMANPEVVFRRARELLLDYGCARASLRLLVRDRIAANERTLREILGATDNAVRQHAA